MPIPQSETPDPMSDNQGIDMGLEVTIPQEALEQIAAAIPAVDLARALMREIHGNAPVLQEFIVAMIRELGRPRSEHIAQAFKDALETLHPR